MNETETFSAEERLTYSSGNTSGPPDLRFIHYNDVYHIDPSSAEPIGGIARFQTLCNHYRDGAEFQQQPNLITLFSGDAFNPSLESSVTKGSHMVPVLNNIGTDVACVGNHDLDFGVRQFRHLTKQCTFPWLLANVTDPALGDNVPLGNATKTVILTASNGLKVGVIGLVEREWLDTINSLPPNLVYKSASETAKELIPGLRDQGADIVIAVTHQREPNDNKLAENTPPGLIDLILGGHDHYYGHSILNGTHVLRSGTDFKQLSYIEARRQIDNPKTWDFKIVRRDVMSSIEEDPKTLELTAKLTTSLKSKLEKPLGYTASPLDARFTTVRLRESNMGNFVCDLMRHHYGGDCCIMAAGTIRGDQIYPPGVLRVKDIMNCFPFEDPCVVIRVSGQAILDALENSVSTYPALEGRFPQVSNIQFEFDPNLPPRQRIPNVLSNVKIAGEPIDLAKSYKLVTRGYMARGKDGFTSLLVQPEGGEAEEIVSEENGILISMLLRQYFMSLKILGQWSRWGRSMDRHWKKVNAQLHAKHPVIESKTPREEKNFNFPSITTQTSSPGHLHVPDGAQHQPNKVEHMVEDSDDEEHTAESAQARHKVDQKEHEATIIRKVMRKWWRLAKLPGHPSCCDSIDEGEFEVDWTKAIAPRLEGRICILNAPVSTS